MSKDLECPIFVLTDTPDAYGDALNYKGVAPIYVKSIEVLLEQLKTYAMAGLVLEVPKVMKATRTERDRLFNYAGSFPVLRTKSNPRHGFITYLDPKECFFANLDAAVGKRCRNHDRIEVKIECSFACETDPSMANAVEATILDISPGGCFIHSDMVKMGERFIHLRIPQLTNSRPIFSSVRWANTVDKDAARRGMGVMFIDVADDQQDELVALRTLKNLRY